MGFTGEGLGGGSLFTPVGECQVGGREWGTPEEVTQTNPDLT